MPVTRGAKKKLRQDAKREGVNFLVKKNIKSSIKKFRNSPTPKILADVFKTLDTARKKKIFHPNKVNRLKSTYSKLVSKSKK